MIPVCGPHTFHIPVAAASLGQPRPSLPLYLHGLHTHDFGCLVVDHSNAKLVQAGNMTLDGYAKISDGKSCDERYKLGQKNSGSMTLDQCFQHCSKTSSCSVFTWFENVGCRIFSSCPGKGRYRTSTKPSKTYVVKARSGLL